jgi:hypothetical protein
MVFVVPFGFDYIENYVLKGLDGILFAQFRATRGVVFGTMGQPT